MSSKNSFISNLQEIILQTPIQSDDSEKRESEFVEKNYQKAIEEQDIKLRIEYFELIKQNRHERKRYAKSIFILTCIWATLIFIIVILSGITYTKNNRQYFILEIPTSVLITLISTTTLNFFGFFLLVVKYLFHTSEIEKKLKNLPKMRK